MLAGLGVRPKDECFPTDDLAGTMLTETRPPYSSFSSRSALVGVLQLALVKWTFNVPGNSRIPVLRV